MPTPGTIESYIVKRILSNHLITFPEQHLANSIKRNLHAYNNAQNNIKRAYKEREC